MENKLFLATYRAPLFSDDDDFTSCYEHKTDDLFSLIYIHPKTNPQKDKSGLADRLSIAIKEKKGAIFVNDQTLGKFTSLLDKCFFIQISSGYHLERCYSDEVLAELTKSFNVFNHRNKIHSVYTILPD